MEFTFLFLNLAKIHIFISKSTHGEAGGLTGLGNIPKKNNFFSASLTSIIASSSSGSGFVPEINEIQIENDNL